jgi:hypothetical protein
MPISERMQLIKGIREQLKIKALEAKIWQSLQEADNVTINGKAIVQDQELSAELYRRSDPYIR